MVYVDFKGLARKIASHKVLRPEAFNIAKVPQYVECQWGLAAKVCKFCDKKTEDGTIKIKLKKINN